ncbi:MAG: M23 family metallopeptidase [Candidatus Aenigmarchaeota archaeon]|nr:M23 family metallopeptidase [Candidatus Aenigmarchaeota archaeon]
MENKKCPASSCKNRKAIADFMLFLLIVVVAAGLIFFMGLFFGYVPLASNIASIQTNLKVFMTNDDVGTEIVSLLNAKNASVKHIELLGSYQADGIEDNSEYIQPVKDTLDAAFKTYVFSVSGTDISFQNNVPPSIEDDARSAIEGCGSQAIPTELKSAFVWPLPDSAAISSGFGGRELNKGVCSCHPGIDIAGRGMRVIAAAKGTVVRTYTTCIEGQKNCNGGYGNYVVLKHAVNGNVYYTYYDHLATVKKTSGDVNPGEEIGTSGNTGYSTGPHLHFEIRAASNQRIADSIDPCTLFQNIPASASKSCEHEKVAACKYVSGTGVKSYQTDIPLPGPRSGANLRGQVVFKQWE